MKNRKTSVLLSKKSNWIFSDPSEIIKAFRRKLFVTDLLVLGLSLTGLGLTIYANNQNYERNHFTKEFYVKDENRIVYKIYLHDSKEDSFTFSIKLISTIFSLITGTFVRYQFYLNLLILYHEEPLRATIKTSGLNKRMIIEMLVLAFHSPPYFNYIVEIYQFDVFYATYTTESIITILMNARFYLVFRFFFFHHKFNSDMVATICANSGCQADMSFLTKALIHDRKSWFMSMSIICYMLIFGLSIRIAERPYMYISKLDWDYVWNGMWCVIILGVTVGYGDFYPRTHIGRVLGFAAFLFGNFLKSLAEVFLHNTVKFTVAQEKKVNMPSGFYGIKGAYRKIKLSQKYTVMRSKAAQVIKHLLIYNQHQKRFRYPAAIVMQDKRNKNIFAIMRNLVEFRTERHEYNHIKRQPTIQNLYSRLEKNVIGHRKDLNEAVDCLRSILKSAELIEIKTKLIFERARFVQERQRSQLSRVRELCISVGCKDARLEREYKLIISGNAGKSNKRNSALARNSSEVNFLQVPGVADQNEEVETRSRARTQPQKRSAQVKKTVTINIAEERVFKPSSIIQNLSSSRPFLQDLAEHAVYGEELQQARASSIAHERRPSREALTNTRVYEEDFIKQKAKAADWKGKNKKDSVNSTTVGDKTADSVSFTEPKMGSPKDESFEQILSSKKLLAKEEESFRANGAWQENFENVNASNESIDPPILKKSGTLMESTYDNDSSNTDQNSLTQEKYKANPSLKSFDRNRSFPSIPKQQEMDQGGFLMMESIDFEKDCLLNSSKEKSSKQKIVPLNQEPSYGFEFQSFLLLGEKAKAGEKEEAAERKGGAGKK